MKICPLSYVSYNKTSLDAKAQKSEPIFCAKFVKYLPKDIFTRRIRKGLTSITDIAAGNFGTVCKGSIPLSNFFRQINKRSLPTLIRAGISTNNRGVAYCFLKSSANNPISTSFVQDCSVMYLYNKADNTHFMYHIYREVKNEELDFLIKNFMSNGYSSAAIIPGNARFEYEHELYLNKVFEVIKTNNPDAKINVYHFSSQCPEIVGYGGVVYEIPNKTISEQLKNGINPYYIAGSPQATFKIQDIRVSPDLYNLSCCNDLESINAMKQKIKKAKYDKEIKKVFYSILDSRLADLQSIERCTSIEELNRLAKDLYDNDIQSHFTWAYRGYENIISAKREYLKNT